MQLLVKITNLAHAHSNPPWHADVIWGHLVNDAREEVRNSYVHVQAPHGVIDLSALSNGGTYVLKLEPAGAPLPTHGLRSQ